MSVLSFLTLNAFVPKLCHVNKYLTFVKYEELVACITLVVSLKVTLPHVKFSIILYQICIIFTDVLYFKNGRIGKKKKKKKRKEETIRY